MGISNFHIFDSAGNCLFSLNNPEKVDQQQILYGFLYSLKSFTARMSPALIRDNKFFLYSTSRYHLIFYEFPTSIKFVLILSVDMKNETDLYRELLAQLYRDIYVQYVVKNPIVGRPRSKMCEESINKTQQTDRPSLTNMIHCEIFRTQLNLFFMQNNLL